MPHLQQLKWDYKDIFKEVTLDLAGNKAYYVYDASGNRVRKIVKKGSIIEDRIYIGNYEIYKKITNGTLNVERETLHIADDKQRIAQIDSDITTTTTRYQLSDHLGSASVELDENADIISYEEYYPFGTTSYRSGRTETEVSQKRYKYVMKELDNETGLYYYGMRYYASWIARFVSVDPLQHDYPELTTFQYASNRPIVMIDIDGLEGAYSLHIYSPALSKQFTDAKDEGDLYRQRAITYYARTHHFDASPEGKENYVLKSLRAGGVSISSGTDYKDFPAAQLFVTESMQNSLTVHTYQWEGNDSEKGRIISTGQEFSYQSRPPTGLRGVTTMLEKQYNLFDAKWPVDSKHGTDFYSDNDVVGIEGGAEITGPLPDSYVSAGGSGGIARMKGMGLFSYLSYIEKGSGFNIGIALQIIFANYTGENVGLPENFVGNSSTIGASLLSGGASLTVGSNDNGESIWNQSGVNIGIGPFKVGASKTDSNSFLLYPKPGPLHDKFDENNWNDRLIPTEPTIIRQ